MDIHWHPQLSSTNDEAHAQAKLGAPHGTLIGADFQSAGRGRTGKRWSCEPGDGLMCSIILRPEWELRYWGWIALTAGLALAELLERDCLTPQLKYPNDVLVNGKKIAGILTEATSDYVIVGIGMNLNMQTVPEVTSSIPPTSFYLETDCQMDASAYARTIQRSLVDLLASPSPLLLRREIERRLAWLHHSVTLQDRGTTRQGQLMGLGTDGQLLLESDQQEVELYDVLEMRPVG